MYKQLETERLFIRPIEIKDKNFILDLLNTQGWLKFIGNRNVKDGLSAEKYIQKIIDNKNCFYSIFELKENKLPIGIVTFIYRDNQNFPDIGFAMLPNFEKKGYALEATKKYLDEIKKECTTDKIIAITNPDNINSIKLLETLGLQFEKSYFDNSIELCLYSLSL